MNLSFSGAFLDTFITSVIAFLTLFVLVILFIPYLFFYTDHFDKLWGDESRFYPFTFDFLRDFIIHFSDQIKEMFHPPKDPMILLPEEKNPQIQLLSENRSETPYALAQTEVPNDLLERLENSFFLGMNYPIYELCVCAIHCLFMIIKILFFLNSSGATSAYIKDGLSGLLTSEHILICILVVMDLPFFFLLLQVNRYIYLKSNIYIRPMLGYLPIIMFSGSLIISIVLMSIDPGYYITCALYIVNLFLGALVVYPLIKIHNFCCNHCCSESPERTKTAGFLMFLNLIIAKCISLVFCLHANLGQVTADVIEGGISYGLSVLQVYFLWLYLAIAAFRMYPQEKWLPSTLNFEYSFFPLVSAVTLTISFPVIVFAWDKFSGLGSRMKMKRKKQTFPF